MLCKKKWFELNSNHFFYFKDTPSVSNITIVDLQGREVLSDKLNRDELRKTLNINGLAKGFYVVSIQNKDFIATQKFVKNWYIKGIFIVGSWIL